MGGPRAAHLGWTQCWTPPRAGVGAPQRPCRRLLDGRLTGAHGVCGDGGPLSESQRGAGCQARGPGQGGAGARGCWEGRSGVGWAQGGHVDTEGIAGGGREGSQQDLSLHSPLDGKKTPGVASLTTPLHVHRHGDTQALASDPGRNRPAAPGEAVGQARLVPEPWPPTSPAGSCPASPLSRGRAGGARGGQGTAMWGRALSAAWDTLCWVGSGLTQETSSSQQGPRFPGSQNRLHDWDGRTGALWGHRRGLRSQLCRLWLCDREQLTSQPALTAQPRTGKNGTR